MKRILNIMLPCALIVIGMVSCKTKSGSLPEATGKEGEMVVVIDKQLWEGACGDSIRHYFSSPVLGLPQPEPMFSLIQQQELTNFMQKFRNIVVVKVDPGYETGALTYQTDVWAKNQLVFNITAPSPDSMIACISRNKDLLLSRYLTKDRDTHIAYYKRIIDEKLVQKLSEKFQVDICIPREYSMDVEKNNFVWLAREEGERIMGILMWKDPYTSEVQLESDQLLARINGVMKANVPGSDPGSYMATTETDIPYIVRRFTKDSVYCVKINGLWQTEGSFMGGPYTSLTIVDVKRNQLVTGVGFVFFPRKDKRYYIRQLEAILYTMTPVPEGSPKGELPKP